LVGVYTGRILKGERAAELAIPQSRVINLRTAKALGLNMPLALIACADEAID
jgi:putative ABC transport system substrate-binding protein